MVDARSAGFCVLSIGRAGRQSEPHRHEASASLASSSPEHCRTSASPMAGGAGALKNKKKSGKSGGHKMCQKGSRKEETLRRKEKAAASQVAAQEPLAFGSSLQGLQCLPAVHTAPQRRGGHHSICVWAAHGGFFSEKVPAHKGAGGSGLGRWARRQGEATCVVCWRHVQEELEKVRQRASDLEKENRALLARLQSLQAQLEEVSVARDWEQNHRLRAEGVRDEVAARLAALRGRPLPKSWLA